MITVIVLHPQHSAIYMLPNRKTVSELMAHWISDCGIKASPNDMKFLTLDGYTLCDGTYVESIPLSDVETRCVKALSRNLSSEEAAEQTALALDTAAEDIVAVRERQLEQERKMKAVGLYIDIQAAGDEESVVNGDDEDDIELQSVAATFTDTALEYKRNISVKLGMPLDSFRLRRGNDEKVDDNVRLIDQGIAHDTLLVVEKRRLITVNVVTRSHSYSKKPNVFKDDLVAEDVLERNIPIEDQRLCYNGCRLSVTRRTTVLDLFGEDRFMTALPLHLALVIREPVILTRKHRSRAVTVWPEDVASCLLEVPPEVEPPAPMMDSSIEDRWAFKPELINDVLFNEDEAKPSKPGSLFHNGEVLDLTKTFAELALPPWAVVAQDPLDLVFVKEYEFDHRMKVPQTLSVADAKKMLLKEKPGLYAEDFTLSGPGRRHMNPANSQLMQWGLKSGDRVTIEPIRVPQIVLLRRRH